MPLARATTGGDGMTDAPMVRLIGIGRLDEMMTTTLPVPADVARARGWTGR